MSTYPQLWKTCGKPIHSTIRQSSIILVGDCTRTTKRKEETAVKPIMLVVVTRTGYNLTRFYDSLGKAYNKAWLYAKQDANVVQIYGLSETENGVCYVLIKSLLEYPTKKMRREFGDF